MKKGERLKDMLAPALMYMDSHETGKFHSGTDQHESHFLVSNTTSARKQLASGLQQYGIFSDGEE